MAFFQHLSEVGNVLAESIRTSFEPPLNPGWVVVGAPLEDSTSRNDHIRISLMWLNEQSTHRNDRPERGAGGELVLPPVSLQAVFLVTTYGSTEQGEMERAHQLLGGVVRAFHSRPTLRLPLPGGKKLGEGPLDVVMVPLTLESTMHLFGSQQAKHRPFVLYEVGPIQLPNQKAPLPPPPVVAPGGVLLGGPSTGAVPSVRQLVPDTQGAGGRVWLDGDFGKAPDFIRVGPVSLPGSRIEAFTPGAGFAFRLPSGPDGVPVGEHPVSIVIGQAASPHLMLRVVGAQEPTLDAPDPVLARGDALVLTGQGLGHALQVLAWPDEALQSPRDVVTLDIASKGEHQLTVSGVAMAALKARRYRVAVLAAQNVYTPHVRVEVRP